MEETVDFNVLFYPPSYFDTHCPVKGATKQQSDILLSAKG